jgi:hypothetical protein
MDPYRQLIFRRSALVKEFSRTVRLLQAFFFVFKRLYGERISNRRFDRMGITMGYRYTLYDIHRECILEAVGA